MPALWNVNSLNNLSNKKSTSKLSFDIGEKFSGRITSTEKDGTVTIKLIDGWQFNAEIDGGADNLPEGLVKFQVQGFAEGKLILKFIGSETESSTSFNALESYLKSLGLSKADSDFVLLLLQHDISLTKENINLMKGILELKSKASQDEEYIDNFIEKYVSAKLKGNNVDEIGEFKTLLKDAFSNLDKLTKQDIMTFIENNIVLSKDNINSFNNLFKEWGFIYKNLKLLEKKLPEDIHLGNEYNDSHLEVPDHSSNEEGSGVNKSGEFKEIINKEATKSKSSVRNSYESTSKSSILTKIKSILSEEDSIEIEHKDIKQEILENSADNKENNGNIKVNKNENILTKENVKNNTPIKVNTALKNNVSVSLEELKKLVQSIDNKSSLSNVKLDEFKKTMTELIYNKLGITYEFNDEEVKDLLELLNNKNQIVSKESIKNTNELVKFQLEEKSSDLKNIISSIIKLNSSENVSVSDRIFSLLKDNINDFKLLNTISNEYYYLDLPIKLYEKEYPLKFIIKDSREKGKKIDSKNVKMVINVATSNLGIVDAYIKVLGSNMNIELKVQDKWVKVLEKEKEKLLNSLIGLGYNTDIIVTKKLEEASISNCREFFNDSMLTMVDVLV